MRIHSHEGLLKFVFPGEISLEQHYLAFKIIEEENNVCEIPTKMIKADFSVTEEGHTF